MAVKAGTSTRPLRERRKEPTLGCPQLITGRWANREASSLSFDAVEAAKTHKWESLGHILKMSEDRLVRRALLATSKQGSSYDPGSLTADLEHPVARCLADFAAERDESRAGIPNAERS